MEKDCIFCKIAKGKIPAVKIWEDKKHFAFLDLRPSREGMTLVIPKKHFESNPTLMPDKPYKDLLIAAKSIAKLLEEKLKVKRVVFAIEGLGVNHIHVKLYPVYDNEAEGSITAPSGPPKSDEELNKVAEKIRGKL